MAKIVIHPHAKTWTLAVRAFNERLRLGGSEFAFPEAPATDAPQRKISQTRYLATEGEEVRGGFILKWQDFAFRGDVHRIAHLKLPLSEGIVDKAYARLGLQIIRQALKTEPLLFCLGMGGQTRPLPTMLKALGWKLSDVPFAFRTNRGGAFLRNIVPLRTTTARELAFDVAATVGVAHVGLKAVHLGQQLRRTGLPGLLPKSIQVEEMRGSFDTWADDLWQRCQGHYAMSAVRDAEILNLLYPVDNASFLKLRVRRKGETIGWAVGLDTQMKDHKQFGNMRLGSIVDCLGHPDDAGAVMSAASRHLRRRGVDLVISNQAHDAWHSALLDDGFVPGPSNFAFAASPKLSALIAPFEEQLPHLHINRGDGDGPINL